MVADRGKLESRQLRIHLRPDVRKKHPTALKIMVLPVSAAKGIFFKTGQIQKRMQCH